MQTEVHGHDPMLVTSCDSQVSREGDSTRESSTLMPFSQTDSRAAACYRAQPSNLD